MEPQTGISLDGFINMQLVMLEDGFPNSYVKYWEF